ncbi:MAG: translation initiation factor IF-3 [Candidatus Zixiibacteriota bacterium]
MKEKELRVNDRIRIPQVRVIDADGGQLGVLNTREAQRIAAEKWRDLVEISPNARPPVCRIMDYGKYKYELAKKARLARKKQHTVDMKEIQLRPNTDDHDYNFKLRHARDFLADGDRVKVAINFRGREVVHQEFGFDMAKRVEQDLGDIAYAEQKAKLEGKTITLIFLPRPVSSGGRPKEARASEPAPPAKPV